MQEQHIDAVETGMYLWETEEVRVTGIQGERGTKMAVKAKQASKGLVS